MQSAVRACGRAVRDDAHVPRRPSSAYSSKSPARGVLYEVVRDHFETFRGRLELVALIEDPRVIRRILNHLGLTEVPAARPRGRLHSRSGNRLRGTARGPCPERKPPSSPQRAAHCEHVVEQVCAPVAEAKGLAVRRTRPSQEQLPAAVTFAALDALHEAASFEAVGFHH